MRGAAHAVETGWRAGRFPAHWGERRARRRGPCRCRGGARNAPAPRRGATGADRPPQPQTQTPHGARAVCGGGAVGEARGRTFAEMYASARARAPRGLTTESCAPCQMNAGAVVLFTYPRRAAVRQGPAAVRLCGAAGRREGRADGGVMWGGGRRLEVWREEFDLLRGWVRPEEHVSAPGVGVPVWVRGCTGWEERESGVRQLVSRGVRGLAGGRMGGRGGWRRGRARPGGRTPQGGDWVPEHPEVRAGGLPVDGVRRVRVAPARGHGGHGECVAWAGEERGRKRGEEGGNEGEGGGRED